jgi:hypothetical protein
VRLHQCAISDRPGSVTLHLSDSNKGHHTLVPGQSDDFSESVTVDAKTGDTIVADIGRTIDVIKLDIEGAEPLALRGLAKTLAQRDLMLFFEFSPEPLRSAGFDPVAELAEFIAHDFVLYHLHGRLKKLIRIEDPGSFTASFRGNDYCNILAIKGKRFADSAMPFLKQ